MCGVVWCVYRQFDKDGSGKLDKSEFKACLYSLGHDVDGQAIDKLMKQYSKDDGTYHNRLVLCAVCCVWRYMRSLCAALP
jgi:Ca2+-binding EF-hand superfamily protein